MLVPKWILGGILATALPLCAALPAHADKVLPGDDVLPRSASVDVDALRGPASLLMPAPGSFRIYRDLTPPTSDDTTPILASASPAVLSGATIRPRARSLILPAARWDDRRGTAMWTRATLAAVDAADLADIVPQDIAVWCPAYAANPESQREAFWVGAISALARYESTHNPRAVGGGGLYFGLLQILPSTARQYGCEARTGEALTDPEDNLVCAVRIMAENIHRDRAVALRDGRLAGIAADWGPMTSASKRADMAAWTADQSYCEINTDVLQAPRPPERPWVLADAGTAAPLEEAIELAMLSMVVKELRAIPDSL